MSDLFSQYGESHVPNRALDRNFAARPLRRQFTKKHKADLSPLEKKLQERARLSRRYRAWRRSETKATLASEPRLTAFLKYLRTVTAETGGELIEAIEACDWLLSAPQPARLFALRMIGARCDHINRLLGNEALDDPLPPETSIYFEARALLHPGGRV